MDIKNKLREGTNNIIYTAVVLNDTSRDTLLSKLGDKIPEGWKTIAHHMTITFGKPLSAANVEAFKDQEVDIIATHIGISDDAIAVKVSGFKTLNNIPHITLAVPQGGSPVNSNKITDWAPLEGTIHLTGVVTEFTRN